MLNNYKLYDNVKIILLFILFISPGILIGAEIVLFIYAITFILVLTKRLDLLIMLYIIWIFNNGGLYQYGFLGNDPSNLLIKLCDNIILASIIFTYLLLNTHLENKIKSSKYIFLFVIISSIVNLVSPVNILVSLNSLFNWLIFGFILVNSGYNKIYYKKLAHLIFTLILINCIFAFFQGTILPIKSTPDGYTPALVDVATGFLGIWRSQILTSLSLILFSYLLLKLISKPIKNNLSFLIIFSLQPIISESKFTLSSGLFLIIVSFFIFYYLIKKNNYKLNLFLAFGGIGLVFSIYFGYNILSKAFSDSRSTSIEIVTKYLETKRNLDDYNKIKGYYSALELIKESPVTLLFGIGPQNFRSAIMSETYNNIILSGFDYRANMERSTFDQNITDFIILLSELGLIGIVLIFIFWYRIIVYINKFSNLEQIALTSIVIEYSLLLIVNSIYLYGFTEPILFIPFWIFYSYVIHE